MANEAKTMQLFRKMLTAHGYFDNKEITVEEQQSDDKKLQKLLQNASKVGVGKGYPDFIISSTKHPELIIVVECKADVARQQSVSLDCYRDYAVDGALLYASFLAKEYDVIAIGISGENDRHYALDAYIQLHGERTVHPYFEHNNLLDFDYECMLINNSIRLKDITIFEFAHTEECLTAQFARIVCKVGTFHMFSFSNRPPSKILGFFKIATNISG